MNRRLTYTFTWPGRKKPSGLAMNCHMKDGQLRFFDTGRGHMIDGTVAKDVQTTDDLQEWYRKTFGEEAGLNYLDVLDN